MQVFFGPLAGSLGALGSEEDFFTDIGQRLAVNDLGATVPVAVGVIEVVDTELVGTAGDRLGLFERAERKTAACLAHERKVLARLPECSLGDVARLGTASLGATRRHTQARESTAEEAASFHQSPPKIRIGRRFNSTIGIRMSRCPWGWRLRVIQVPSGVERSRSLPPQSFGERQAQCLCLRLRRPAVS